MSYLHHIYDVTLRDGAQGPGIKFSADDQIRIIRALDAFGVAYIEGGQPGSNPKAIDLFERARDLDLQHAQLAAFGSTRHPRKAVEDDTNLRELLAADTPVATIFAKFSPLHVAEVLRVSLDENLLLISDTISYLKRHDRTVFLDAEHFFDGYALDPEYAMTALAAGLEAGADILVLCDTNGGSLPDSIAQATRAVRERFPDAPLGIHTHNDCGCAVANTVSAVAEGAVQIQGTINGYGERTGNANLTTIVPLVQLKLGIPLVSSQQLASLTHLSHFVACLLYTSPSPRDRTRSRMPSSA